MDVEFLIDKYQLNDSESQILRYMALNQDNLKKLGVRKVASDLFVSTATIVNMAKKIGFSGYSELVFAFQKDFTVDASPASYNQEEQTAFIQLISKHRRHPIMVLGSGFSQNLANYFSEYLNLYGFRATANSHLEFLRQSAGEDILIMVISNSGDTVRLAELTTMAQEHGHDVIAFVGSSESKIAKLATLTISTQTYKSQNFREFAPNLFYGSILNQFELLMSASLKTLF